MHRIAPAVAALALALVAPASSAAATSSCPTPPKLDPSNFPSQPKVDNPYFPLTPGKTYVYRGKEDDHPTEDRFAVTSDTKVVDGVTTRVVRDQVFTNNVLTEDTLDYFAQDKQGTVWYLGEDTKELDKNGNVVSTEGTWQSGVQGGRAGTFMERYAPPDSPRVGDTYKQEDAKAAQDCAEILSTSASVKVPFGSFNDALQTKEFSLLEPGVVDNKWYAKGVGEVREQTVKGGSDFLELVSVK
ncbi:MAG: hypothetical protein ACJ76S_08290 [Solirubrobacteraceae bacterium]|jgi:hypothetical protein